VELLASLAEDSSSTPSSSQHSAVQLTALEDKDSVVGRGVSLPPDREEIEEDEEETVNMSQPVQADE
jgi:hypothetical protein